MNKRLTPVFLFVFLITFTFQLSGCKVSSAPPSSEVLSESVNSTRLFTDDCGREITIPLEITRIVPSGSLSQIILHAIAGDLFVGLSSEWDPKSLDLLNHVDTDLPVLGSLYSSSDMNVEALALTSPQLIIDIGEPKASIKEDMDTLSKQTGIPCLFISTSLEDMPQTYRTLGKLLNREQRGKELASFCENIYQRALTIMEKVGEKKADTLYILGENGSQVLSANSYHAELLNLLTNNLAVVDNPISKGTGNEVSLEQIFNWKPDFILFDPNSIYADVGTDPLWTQLNAISDRRYVEIPDLPHNWLGMPPAVSRYLGLIWLPYVLYPQQCDYDIKEEICNYFRIFYGCELTDERYEEITANAFLP